MDPRLDIHPNKKHFKPANLRELILYPVILRTRPCSKMKFINSSISYVYIHVCVDKYVHVNINIYIYYVFFCASVIKSLIYPKHNIPIPMSISIVNPNLSHLPEAHRRKWPRYFQVPKVGPLLDSDDHDSAMSYQTKMLRHYLQR